MLAPLPRPQIAQIIIPGHTLAGNRYIVKRIKNNRALLVIAGLPTTVKSRWFTIGTEITLW